MKIVPPFVTFIGNVHILIDNVLPLCLGDEAERLIHNAEHDRINLAQCRQRCSRLIAAVFPLDQV